VEAREFDVVLIDMNYTRDTTSGREGLEMLERIAAIDSTLPVVVMTAWGSVDGAVEAMRRGARDYIEKPWDNARLLTRLAAQVELGRALRRARQLEGENRVLRAAGSQNMIAESPAMAKLLEVADRVAPSDANVLLTGEHGTGKEVLARHLHAASNRSSAPLITVNAGGLSEGLFESELFGHVKGAFTGASSERIGRFELANGGTLFLDEIANISATQQARLLRVLQMGELERVGSSRTQRVDVRIIAATNADLRAEVEAGRFREDLLFRLNTIELALPPLRDRREDIVPLATHFLRQHVGHHAKPDLRVGDAATQALLAHPWPGNVRELEHTIERAVLMAASSEIEISDLGLHGAPSDSGAGISLLTLEQAERQLIERALRRFDGNVSQAARQLGLSRSAFYRRLKAHGL
jgi:DNA-binding NtrC family response regulator